MRRDGERAPRSPSSVDVASVGVSSRRTAIAPTRRRRRTAASTSSASSVGLQHAHDDAVAVLGRLARREDATARRRARAATRPGASSGASATEHAAQADLARARVGGVGGERDRRARPAPAPARRARASPGRRAAGACAARCATAQPTLRTSVTRMSPSGVTSASGSPGAPTTRPFAATKPCCANVRGAGWTHAVSSTGAVERRATSNVVAASNVLTGAPVGKRSRRRWSGARLSSVDRRTARTARRARPSPSTVERSDVRRARRVTREPLDARRVPGALDGRRRRRPRAAGRDRRRRSRRGRSQSSMPNSPSYVRARRSSPRACRRRRRVDGDRAVGRSRRRRRPTSGVGSAGATRDTRRQPKAGTSSRNELDVEAADARAGSAPASGSSLATSRAGWPSTVTPRERRHHQRVHVEAGHADPPRREPFERHAHDVGARFGRRVEHDDVLLLAPRRVARDGRGRRAVRARAARSRVPRPSASS